MSQDRKGRLIERVGALTLIRTREMTRKHNCCISTDAGVRAIAALFKPERVPESDAEIEKLAQALVDWAIPLDRDLPAPPRPYRDDDLEMSA